MPEFYPAAQQIQQPDIYGAYLRGQMAPLQIQQAQQDTAAGGLKLDQLRMTMGYAQQLAQGSQSAGAQSAQAPTGGVQNGPQGQVSSQAPSQPSGSYDGIGTNPRVNTMMALDVLAGRDPLKTAQGAQEYEQKQRQLQAQGPMALAETVSSSPNADVLIRNNPGLQQQWVAIAPKLGLDPFKDLTPANARMAATFGYNQLAGSAGLPPKPMPDMQQDIPGPLGSLYQRDSLTNKVTQVKGEEPLKDVIGPNGLPTNLRASEAEGKQPFNQSIFGAANLSDQAKEFAYQSFIATGKMPQNIGRSPAMQASMMDYISKRAAQEGNSAASIAAKGQAFTATQGVVSDFTKGKSAQALNGINTAVQHMGSLDPLIDALGNGDAKVINRVSNFFKAQTGSAAPTNYAALKEFVGGEVAKAVLPGGGGEAERQALTAPLNAANSPEQLKQAVQTIKTALAGKTEALRNQWDVGTNGTQGDFDKFLLPATKQALGIAAPSAPTGAHPASVQALLDKYK